MNLEKYAAQYAQEPQQAPQAQETLTVEQVAAKLDAEKLSSLMAQLQEAIDEQAAPAAMLQAITGTLFGTSSPQAAAVAQIIDADQHPGGHELAIAAIRQRRKFLNQQLRQLREQSRTVEAELDAMEEAERQIAREWSEAAALDTALADTLTLCKTLDPQQPDLLQQLEGIYNRHHSDLASMGLLYGCIAELTRRQYKTGTLDLVQQEALADLKERVAAAITA